MGGISRPSPAFVSASDALADAPRQKRRGGFFRKLGRGFKAVGRGLRKIAPLAIGIGATIAIPGVGSVLAKGVGRFGRFGRFAGKAISRGAVAAGKRVGRGGRTFGREITGTDGDAEAVYLAGPLSADMFHQTSANMPTEILEYITSNNLLPSIGGVAAVAQAFGGQVRGPKQNQIYLPDFGDTVKLVWGTNQSVLVGKWGWDPTGRETGRPQRAGIGPVGAPGGAGPTMLPSDPADVPEEWIVWLSQDPRTAPWLDAIASDVFQPDQPFSDLQFEEQQTVVLGLLLES